MLRLLVDGQELRVEAGHKISLGYDADDLSDVQSGRTAGRVTMRVPSTPESDELFSDAGNPLTARRFNASQHRAEIVIDSTRLFAGTAVLTGTERSGGALCYLLEIKGDTALWARSAALRRLSDAEIVCSGKLTPAEIVKSWSDNRAVKYFPVNRGEAVEADSSVSLMPVQRAVLTDDYWPFISVEALVKACFADAGYRVESKFMQTQLFRSLYISGRYNSAPDAAARRRTMDFLAGRLADASTTADYFGRVYLTSAIPTNSVGNVVDTVESFITDEAGKSIPTGFFSTNGCFYIDSETGTLCFSPKSDVVVGFELSLAFITDHRIKSRKELAGMNRIYVGDGQSVPFKIVNNYADQREKPLGDFNYKLMIFDADASCRYRLTCKVNGSTSILADTSARMTAVKTPAGTITEMRLLRSDGSSGVFSVCNEDWALYWGYVEERGSTEVEVKIRIAAENIKASSVKRFSNLFIEGGEAGMNFTLLKRTTLRPIFSATAGYGSTVRFADVADSEIRQCDLLAALGQMFDLQFCTDEAAKTVYIEPYGDFFTGDTVDWSDRIDRDKPITTADPSLAMHERVTLGYGDDDAAVTRFNTLNGGHLGRWTFEPASQAALTGEQTVLNPLFSPTVSSRGCVADASSAWIMQVRDGEAGEDDNIIGNFSTRIVRYAGLRPLAEGEVWDYEEEQKSYPLAAFHFAGDNRTEGFSLCFEDRDGMKGLNAYRERRLREFSEGVVVTLWLHLHPEEVSALGEFREGMPSVRSLFRLDIDESSAGALYTLRSIEGYDPAKPTVRCTFVKVASTI